jgi:hypothetical protein
VSTQIAGFVVKEVYVITSSVLPFSYDCEPRADGLVDIGGSQVGGSVMVKVKVANALGIACEVFVVAVIVT